MSPGVADERGPPPSSNEQQVTSSVAGLRDSIAETEEDVSKLRTQNEIFGKEIDILNRCLRERTFTCDNFTVDALGEAVRHFAELRPSEATFHTIINMITEDKKV